MADGKALSSDNEGYDEEQHQRSIQVATETCGVQITPKHEQL